MVDRKDGSNAFGRRYFDRSLSFGAPGSFCSFCVMGCSVLGCAMGSWRLLNVRIILACTSDMAIDDRGEICTRQ